MYRIKIPIILLIGSIPFLSLLISWDSILLYRDSAGLHYPAKVLFWDAFWNEHQIPLWNFFNLGGTSIYEDCSLGLLYPLNFIFLFFTRENIIHAFPYYITIHFILTLCGWYLIFWNRCKNSTLSLLLSLPLVFGGYQLSTIYLLHTMSGTLAAPWFFYFLFKYLAKNNLWNLLPASFFLSLPIYGGEPQFTYLLSIIAIYFFCKKKLLGITHYILLIALTILCSAAQLLPALALAKDSFRGFGNFSSNSLLQYSLHPIRLLEFIFPMPFGSIQNLLSYKAQPYINGPDPVPFIQHHYIGILFIFIALTYSTHIILQKKRMGSITKKNIAFAALFGITILLSLGSYSPLPLYSLFAEIFPFWNFFRYPERLSYWILLLMAYAFLQILPKYFSYLEDAKNNKAHFRSILLPHLFIFFFISALGWQILSATTFYYVLSLLLVYLAIILMNYCKKINSSQFLLALLLLSLFDFYRISFQSIWTTPSYFTQKKFYKPIQLIEEDFQQRKTQLQLGAPRKFVSLDQEKIFWNELNRFQNIDDIGKLLVHMWSNLGYNLPSVYGIENALGYSTLMNSLRTNLWFNSDKNQKAALLNLWGVYYLLGRSADASLTVKYNLHAHPYLYFSNEILHYNSFSEGLQKIPQASKEKSITNEISEELLSTIPTNTQIKIVNRNSSQMQLEILSAQPIAKTLLVWNEGYSKYWQAFIGENHIPMFLINMSMMGTLLENIPGNTPIKISFIYNNPLIFYGKILTCIWILIFGILYIVNFWTVKRKRL